MNRGEGAYKTRLCRPGRGFDSNPPTNDIRVLRIWTLLPATIENTFWVMTSGLTFCLGNADLFWHRRWLVKRFKIHCLKSRVWWLFVRRIEASPVNIVTLVHLLHIFQFNPRQVWRVTNYLFMNKWTTINYN